VSAIGRFLGRLAESRRLFASLEPQRMAAVCIGGHRWRGSQPVLSNVEAPITSAPGRETLTALLASALPTGPRPRTLAVTLSDLLVRYRVVRRPDGVRSLRELRELALQQLCERFDLDAADWEFRLDTALLGTHDAICAMPKALVQDLRNAAADTGLRLASVRPHFAVVAQRHRHGLRDGWMATVEGEGLTLAACADQRITDIRVMRSAQALDDLPAELRRNTVALGRQDALPLHVAGVSAAGRQRLSLPFVAVDAESWPGEGPIWSERYRMALAPVWPRRRA
jgi:hypothetical protein